VDAAAPLDEHGRPRTHMASDLRFPVTSNPQ